MALYYIVLFQALDSSVAGVTSIKEDCGRSSAAIDDHVFDIPRGQTVHLSIRIKIFTRY